MGALPVPCEAREWISSNQLPQAPGDGSGAQAHRRASRVRERARSAVAAAGGHERRLRALAGHHCAAPCRRGASARATRACGLWLRTATTDFGGHFDPKEVLLPPPDPYTNRRGIKFTSPRNSLFLCESHF